ncbi:alpha-ketoglutarate-dependent dioxygenase AlkB [Embleya sp. NPDC008237]|uniref:alpha-ketoglutarate-dependent dioxygenase AlkB n=1 Tax=Embleya sp. NPDC008237 TaxID=3363978 RepID=UPI0036E4F87A
MAPPPLGIRLLPGVSADPDADLAFVSAEVVWDERMRARRTAGFGVPYNYANQRYAATPMPPRIAAIAARAEEHAGHPFDNCLANLYETGDNTMGFHQDSYEDLVPGSAIAIVSLGATRRLVFRSLDRVHEKELALEHGSLLLMTGVTQRGWSHAVPRERTVGRRVSLTFRYFDRASTSTRRGSLHAPEPTAASDRYVDDAGVDGAGVRPPGR